MVRLVEENRRLAPGALFVAPIGVLIRNHRINVSADLRIAQHLGRVSRGPEQVFQTFLFHLSTPISRRPMPECRQAAFSIRNIKPFCHMLEK